MKMHVVGPNDPEAVLSRHSLRVGGIEVVSAQDNFLNWWMTGLGAAFALFIGHISAISVFIHMRYLEWIAWLFGISIALALLGKLAGTIASAKFKGIRALHDAREELEGMKDVNEARYIALMRDVYLPPFRWFISDEIHPLWGIEKAVRWGQVQTIGMHGSLYIALAGVVVLVVGFNT